VPRLTIKFVILALLVALCAYPTVREYARPAAIGGDVTTVRFWNMFAGPDGRTMLAMVRRFNKENPDVQVIMQRMDWGPYYNKLLVAGLGGRAPDVFVVHADVIRRFMLAGVVRPVDDIASGPAPLDVADLDQNIWNATADESGRHWGVPLDVHPIGLYYNRKLFRLAGLVDAAGNPKPPTNRAEFLDALRRLKGIDRDGDGQGDDTWGFVYTWLRTNAFTILRQFDGQLYDPAIGRPTFDTPKNVEALTFAATLVNEGLAPNPQNFDSWVGFLQGKVGMTFEGIYKLDDLRRQAGFDYGTAPVPTLGSRPAAWVNSHNLCLRSGLDGKELAAAQRFVKFLSDNSLDWAAGGQVPVRKSLRETRRFQEQMPAQKTFAAQIPHAAYMPSVPYIFEIQSEFDYCVERALRGTATAGQALGDAQQRMDAVANRYRTPDAAAGGAP
jgi:multiple sugar transport system substrate-binding protein